MRRCRWFCVAVFTVAFVVVLSARAGTRSYKLEDPNNFKSSDDGVTGETPAIVDPGYSYWRADDTDDGQHMIYVQGGKAGTEPDPADGVNPQLLWNDSEPAGDGGAGRPETQVTMGDIVSLSWNTWKTGGATANDWFIDIYTKPDGTNDDYDWYGSNYEFSAGSGETDGYASESWTTWGASADGSYQDTTDDVLATKVRRHYQGDSGTGYSDSHWLNDLPADWASESIRWVSISTGSGEPGTTWGDFAGKLDSFSFTYSTSPDETVNINFTPEPGSGLLIIIGFAAMCLRRKRRA